MKHTINHEKELSGKTFLLALGVAAAFFIPYIVIDQGYFLFFGDFNVQQVPFYQMCHEMVRSGNIGWNWNTDLGVNFIGSYSFYLLGSPFFWLTLPFPNWMIPYLMGPLLILKFATAALTAYLYIRRFTRTPRAAMLGGLLYAFSGFSVYNIFFNHFHEAIILFPLLLLSIEWFITENRRGPVCFMVFLCAVSNYFFFFGMVVFVIIYWFVRMLSGCWKLKFTNFLWLLFECVLGLLLSAAILYPSILAILQNERVSSFSYGWNAVMYGKEQIYLNIMQCFFFPPDLPARPVFFPNADVKWSSLGAWLPVFSMVGVFAWMQGKKGHWLRRIIGIMVLMAAFPFLNSAFYMFNQAYYARWFYMPILMMCLATVMACEDREVNWNSAFRWTMGITLAFSLVIGFMPSKIENGKITQFGIFTQSDNSTYIARFWITCAISIISLIILKFILSYIRKNPKVFYRLSICTVCIVSVLYAAFFIGSGKLYTFDSKSIMIDKLLEGNVQLEGNSDNYRVDVYDGVDNTGMYLGLPTINAFHSIVPGSVTDFYKYIGEERGVASRPKTDFYAIRPLLSVKYVLNREGSKSFKGDDGKFLMPGYMEKDMQNGYHIYENENYIPYGFTYDYYMTQEQANEYGKENISKMMLKAILLDESQINRHNDILKDISLNYNIGGGYDINRESVAFDDETFAMDCARRATNTAYSFQRDNGGFTAAIDLPKDNLVFFSVPFENGWTAYIDNKKVDIEKVNVGFMAVRAPMGHSVIRFEYRTPGLMQGLLVTAGASIALLVYILVCFILKSKKPGLFATQYPEGEFLSLKFAQYDKDDLLIDKTGEEEPEEPSENFNPDEAYFGFEGGFKVDDSFLKNPEEQMKLSDFSKKKDNEEN